MIWCGENREEVRERHLDSVKMREVLLKEISAGERVLFLCYLSPFITIRAEA